MIGVDFIIDKTISVGHIATASSVIVSTAAIAGSWYKDRQLRRKEYADRVRRTAGMVVAKLERWKELNLRFFDDIEPVITDADIMLIEKRAVIPVRDFLWRELVKVHTECSMRILQEQIEIAYADLYGYDPRVQELFTNAILALKQTDLMTSRYLLDALQRDVLMFQDKEIEVESAQLGNQLRGTAGNAACISDRAISYVLSVFRAEMSKILGASDKDIICKRMDIRPVDYAELPDMLEGIQVTDWETSGATGAYAMSLIEPRIDRKVRDDSVMLCQSPGTDSAWMRSFGRECQQIWKPGTPEPRGSVRMCCRLYHTPKIDEGQSADDEKVE